MLFIDHCNVANEKLQESLADLSCVVRIYSSLALFVQDMRDKQFSEYEGEVQTLSVQVYCQKTRKNQTDGSQMNERIPQFSHEDFYTNVYSRIKDTWSIQFAGRKVPIKFFTKISI